MLQLACFPIIILRLGPLVAVQNDAPSPEFIVKVAGMDKVTEIGPEPETADTTVPARTPFPPTDCPAEIVPVRGATQDIAVDAAVTVQFVAATILYRAP